MSSSSNEPDSSMRSGCLRTRSDCRGCRGGRLERVLSLAATPPANAFLKPDQLHSPELFFPLDLYLCQDCRLVQLIDVVSPELLFRDYVYVSSTSPVFIRHFEDFAETVIQRLQLRPVSLVVDIGSNDGILLRPYSRRGIRVLGVDPAVRIAEAATRSGILTLPQFFTAALAQEIAGTYGQADVVTATSVFPHVDDLDDLVQGVRTLLQDDGVFILEAYYLADFLQKNLFDTIYHEHLSYFSVESLQATLERLGLKLFAAERVQTHGGSLRAFACKYEHPRAVEDSVIRLREEEADLGLGLASTFHAFARRIEYNREQLLQLLRGIKEQGKTIAGYGAPAKGNTLLNHFGIDTALLDYIVDDSPWKQGLFTPGTHIPVVGPQALVGDRRPDYLLILAWNFASPIMQKCGDFHAAGGRFIVPVPEPQVI